MQYTFFGDRKVKSDVRMSHEFDAESKYKFSMVRSKSIWWQKENSFYLVTLSAVLTRFINRIVRVASGRPADVAATVYCRSLVDSVRLFPRRRSRFVVVRKRGDDHDVFM